MAVPRINGAPSSSRSGLNGSSGTPLGMTAAGVILLLWLNYTAWAILYGAELNAELDRQARRSAP